MRSEFHRNAAYGFGRAAVVLAAAIMSFAALSMAQEPAKSDICAMCHTCEKPSAEAPCLKTCERPNDSEADKRFSESQSSPDVIVIKEISELYMPVIFPHRLHASMEAMSDGCTLCHHHEVAGKPQPCSACHGNFTEPGNLWKPGLRGAYHRHCLSCHRDWSGETACLKCHAERAPGQPIDPKPDLTDIIGRLHPNVQEPDKKVYQTPKLEEGMMVTFNHKEHVQTFGKRCVDCHAEENCNRCHNRTDEAPKRVRHDPHQDCAKCHDVNGDCTQCHMKTESSGFDHAKRSGFAMNAFHESVACQKCHKDPATFKGLKAQCAACHGADWSPKGFDHAKSGKLALDDKHRDVDCAGCHPNGMGAPVNCESCHEKTFVYPQKLPGTRLDVQAWAPRPIPAPMPSS